MAWTLLAHVRNERKTPADSLGVGGEAGMQVKQGDVSEKNRCQRAVSTILEVLKLQCQGFILPPAEVKRLLALPDDGRPWHLHESVARLKKDLANRYVAMEINPSQGITVMLYRVPVYPHVLCSPRSLRQ